MKTSSFVLYTILIMMVYSCSAKSEQTSSETVFTDTLQADTVIHTDTSTYGQSEPTTQQEVGQAPANATKGLEIVNFRIQNSFVNTDKSFRCSIYIDEQSKIVVLRALNGVDTFTLTSEGDGVFSLNFFQNKEHQATKTVYRRNDLEDETDAQIYSSRTGEIILTLSYP